MQAYYVVRLLLVFTQYFVLYLAALQKRNVKVLKLFGIGIGVRNQYAAFRLRAVTERTTLV
jgi:hypothetical protein